MGKIILISIPEEALQEMIYSCVKAALHNTIPQSLGQQIEVDRWMDIDELCSYLPDKPAKATIYTWVSLKTIPVHKGKKKLRFLKSEIDSWLITERRKTREEISLEAKNYVKNSDEK